MSDQLWKHHCLFHEKSGIYASDLLSIESCPLIKRQVNGENECPVSVLTDAVIGCWPALKWVFWWPWFITDA